MAVVWEQKKLVETLNRLETDELSRLPYEGATVEEQVHHTYTSMNGYFIWETVLIKEMLRIRGKEESDIGAIVSIQKTLNSCIKDEFILWTNNETFLNIDKFPLPEGINPNANSSPRRIRVSDDKGSELMNRWYFLFKYIPGALRPIEQIFVQVVVAVLITLLTIQLVGK